MRNYYDTISGWAGAAVALCLFGGLAIQHPDPARLIGVILLITWGVGRFINWKWG